METYAAAVFQNCSNIVDAENCFVPERAAYYAKISWHVPITAVTVYFTAIISLRMFMSNRKAFDLRRPLVLWNAILAIFSIIATLRTFPLLQHYIHHYGLLKVACQGTNLGPHQRISFWIWLQVYSKIFELGDTFFIVLRKKKLVFLHWYHHVSVLLFSWLCFEDLNPVGAIYGMLNFAVHSMMYAYYCLRALGMTFPSWISRSITLCQIFQMFVGCYVTFLLLLAKLKGVECYVTNKVSFAAMGIYISYLILFVNYFYMTYIYKDRRTLKKNL